MADRERVMTAKEACKHAPPARRMVTCACVAMVVCDYTKNDSFEPSITICPASNMRSKT